MQFALPAVPRPSLSSGHTVIFLLRAKKKHKVPKEVDRSYSPCAYKREKKTPPPSSSAKFQKCTTLHLQLGHAVSESRNAVSMLSADSLGVRQTLAHFQDAVHDDGVDSLLRLQLAVVDVII
jgi:hypothetical protein